MRNYNLGEFAKLIQQLKALQIAYSAKEQEIKNLEATAPKAKSRYHGGYNKEVFDTLAWDEAVRFGKHQDILQQAKTELEAIKEKKSNLKAQIAEQAPVMGIPIHVQFEGINENVLVGSRSVNIGGIEC